jgi:hypothetical protein
MSSTVSLRPARPNERHVLQRLAGLDSAPGLHGEVILAVQSGRAVAAMSLEDDRVVADPFVPSASAVELLRTYVAGLHDRHALAARRARRRRSARRGALRLAH